MADDVPWWAKGDAAAAPGTPAWALDEAAPATPEKPGHAGLTTEEVQAGARGVRKGVSLGFDKKISAAGAASPLAQDVGGEKFTTALDPVIGAIRMLLGSEEAKKAYGTELERQTTREKELHAAHPQTMATGEFAGSMLTPIPGTTAVGRAAGGAAVGGLSALGEDNPTGGGVAASAALGGGVNAALPPVLRGAGQLLSHLSPVQMLRAWRNPDWAAGRKLGQAEMESGEAEIQAALRGNQPNALPANRMGVDETMFLDTLGRPGQTLGRTAANISPEARTTLEGPLYGRRDTQYNRLEGELPQPQHGSQEERLTALRAQDQPATAQAYRQVHQVGEGAIPATPTMQRMVEIPAVQRAMRDAEGEIRGRWITENLAREARGQPPLPEPSRTDMRFWTEVDRQLGANETRALSRPETAHQAQHIGEVQRVLQRELDTHVPGYATARDLAHAGFDTQRAATAGRRFVTENYTEDQTRALLAGMNARDRGAFQDAFVEKFLQDAERHRSAGDLWKKILTNEPAWRKVEMVLGPQGVAQLRALHLRERIMQQGLESVVGNSTTARQLGAIKDFGLRIGGGAAAGYGLGADDLADVSSVINHPGTAAGVATALVRRRIDQRVANRVAELLVSRNPQEVRRVIDLAARDPRIMQALHDAERMTTKAAVRGSLQATREQQ